MNMLKVKIILVDSLDNVEIIGYMHKPTDDGVRITEITDNGIPKYPNLLLSYGTIKSIETID